VNPIFCNIQCKASRFKTLGLAIGLICAASQGFAQSNELESIVVTANRQQSELRDIASSIYAVDSESLERASHVHISEALTRVPGAWVSRGNGQEHLTAIRSPVLTGAGSCGAFQMSQDGIPLRGAGFCNVNQLFEANSEQAGSIEVIRGPGSVLYGANALHGTINVISQGVSEELSGDISLEAGPHSYGRVKTSVSSSSGRQGVRVNFNGATDGGYKDDSGFDQQKLSLIHKYNGSTYTVSSIFDATNLNQETAGYVLGADAYKDSALKKSNPNPEAFRDAESYRLHSRIEWETAVGNWVVTPYFRKTEMDFLMHFLPGAPLEENGQESYGLQTMFSSSGSGDLQWLAGIDIEFTDGYLRQTQASATVHSSAFLRATLPAGQHYDFDVDAELFSAYGQLTYSASEQNSFTLGLRTEHLGYDYNNKMIDGRTKDDGVACGFGGCRYSRPSDRSDSFNNVSAQLGWIHDFDDQQQVFANLSHAFRAPQANEMYRLQNDQLVADLNSEEVDSLDVGYRATRENISYAISVFYMEKDDVIFQNSDRENVSGGSTKHRGVEFNTEFTLSEQLSLAFAGSYARHTYEGNIAPRGVSVVIDGNDIDTAPKFTSSAQLNWQINSIHNVELEWVHMGSYYTNEANTNKYDGHDLLNLRYRAEINDSWYFSARATNLLDIDYAERADFAFGDDRYFIGEPASLYVTIGSRF
jgi:iron complex outermembrane recepter protein